MKSNPLMSRGDYLLNKYAPIVQPVDVFTARYLSLKSREESEMVFDFVIILSTMLRANRVSMSLKEFEGRGLPELLEAIHPELRERSYIKESDSSVLSVTDVFSQDQSSGADSLIFTVITIERLLKSGLFLELDQFKEPNELFEIDTPLILQGGWVYFRRQWVSEWYIIQAINLRLDEKYLVDESQFSESIHKLFFDENGKTSGQVAAALTANRFPFSIITGGPGTGKTRTIVGFLAATLEINPDLDVVLCAPTGKAASRMVESIQNALKSDNRLTKVGPKIPQIASTIHRLLGWNPSTGTFKHHEDNPILADLIIVDEASMIDLVMFSRLLRAISPDCRVIMLGDKDQLASVEAGSVFGDLIRAGLGVSDSRLSKIITRLKHSWRFKLDSGLGLLADWINNGDFHHSWEFLESNSESIKLISANFGHSMLNKITSIHADISNLATHKDNTVSRMEVSQLAEQALNRLGDYQVLTAHKTGQNGAIYLNKFIDQQLSSAPSTEWYAGRPVIATENDYDNGVFNGDLGITIQIAHEFWVYFGIDKSTGKVRLFKPSQLSQVESAWALTVHKSQGSEYKEILFILPEYNSPVLSRELLYTAVTRARESVNIVAQKSVWMHAIQSSLYQEGGFLNRLNLDE